jgi:hypothetical protein
MTYGLCKGAPPPRKPEAIARTFDVHFGGLARHALQPMDDLPIAIHCEGCRNNQGARRTSVCETHAGTLQGIVEAVVGAPLKVTYAPESDGGCKLMVQAATTDDGRALIPWARRAGHITIEAYTQGFAVCDTRTGVRTPVNAAAWRLLNEVGDFQAVPALAQRLEISPQFLEDLVKDAHQKAWIEVDFWPTPS